MKSFKHNNKNNFLAGWYIDKKICSEMIKYFDITKETPAGIKHEGSIGGPEGDFLIDKKLKDSLDISVFHDTTDDIPKRYLDGLAKVMHEYKM